MEILADLTLEEMTEMVKKYGQQGFRAAQLYKWVNLGVDFSKMSNLPQGFRDELKVNFIDIPLKIIKTLKSSDGSEKYLYEFADGEITEGVFMPHSYGNTLCVSTQIGCRMGCGFCASGIGGLVRNLTAGEILGQIIVVNALHGGNLEKRQISNVVLMGSGEPLDNYENVTKFIRLATAEKGLNISQRSISLSTCGLADKIKQLADEGYSVTLSISLHATTDETRQEIMPIANKFTLYELFSAVKYYFEKTGRRIIFEYSLIKEKNMNFLDAKRLAELTKGFPAHINLIMLNPVKEKNIKGCTKSEAEAFLKKLISQNLSATIRKSSAQDVQGGCGQLRNQYVGAKPPASSGQKSEQPQHTGVSKPKINLPDT